MSDEIEDLCARLQLVGDYGSMDGNCAQEAIRALRSLDRRVEEAREEARAEGYRAGLAAGQEKVWLDLRHFHGEIEQFCSRLQEALDDIPVSEAAVDFANGDSEVDPRAAIRSLAPREASHE